jgi:hypothetical protein
MAVKRFSGLLSFMGVVSLVSLMFVWSATAGNLRVEIRGAVLDLQAEAVPLSDVLRAVSAKTGLVVKAQGPLTEVVNCHFMGLTLEQGVKQLMQNRNYALMLSEATDERSTPPKLWVMGTGFGSGTTGSSLKAARAGSEEIGAYPYERQNVHRKDWLAGEVRDSKKLSRQFSAAATGARTGEQGIKISSLAPNSVLQKIGIGRGDLVSIVNGWPISSTEDFISALQSAVQEGSRIMMIERRKSDGRLDPVYVHLD